MPRFSFQKRSFLNPPSTGSTSYVFAQVQDTDEGKSRWGGNLIIIADCHRSIELEFCLGDRKHRRRSLAKLNLLIKILTTFRDALNREVQLIEKRR